MRGKYFLNLRGGGGGGEGELFGEVLKENDTVGLEP